ncbi:MAG: hypothetical protein K1X78_28140 [Verrucomicrobiaceae bacterium]|nr:hypothetical protein [Verrucomicrobiaceae bacterium]
MRSRLTPESFAHLIELDEQPGNSIPAMLATSDPHSGNRVFISCVTTEFEDCTGPFKGFRTRIAKELRAADCEVKVQEDFRQTDEDTVEKLDLYIRRCAAVIHLVGRNPGAKAHPKAVAAYLDAVPDFLHAHPEVRAALGDFSDLTYTQWESFMALHHGIALRMYVTPEGKTTQAHHLDRLRLGRKYPSDKPIVEPADLAWTLIGDLRYIIPSIPLPKQRLSPPRFIHHAAEHFLGREPQLALLDEAWANGTNVLSIIAWGGVGKTALITEWVQTRFIEKQWKTDDGQPALDAYFDWTFYDQGTRSLADGTEARTGSVGDFFEQALAFFGDPDPNLPGKGRRLADLIRQQRSLIILDGLEPLQQPPGHPQAGRLLDPDLRDLLAALAVSNPGLCLITSRQALTDLHSLRRTVHTEHELEDLPVAIAIRLLRQLQIKGTDQELAEASEKFGCHALSLTLLGRYLCDAHDGDIRRLDRIDLQRADTLTREDRHRTAWRILETYEHWLATAQADGNPKTLAVLRLTGLFDRTATADCLAALRAKPAIPGLTDAICDMADDEWNILLKRLERAHLIKLCESPNPILSIPDQTWSIDVHPLIREYITKRLSEQQTKAFHFAHRRLFNHLQKITPDRPSLLADEIQHLYQAIVHGCHAGCFVHAFKDVYYRRIQNRNAWHATNKLGLVGADWSALSHFFTKPWTVLDSRLSLEIAQRVTRQAAFSLRASGQLAEAESVGALALKLAQQAPDERRSDIIAATQLSAVKLLLGKLNEAILNGEVAVALSANYQGKDIERLVSPRCTLANALFHGGNRPEAERGFADAERIEKVEFPVLGELQAYVFHLLILSEAERSAWKLVVNSSNSLSPLTRAAVEACCKSVEDRLNLRQRVDQQPIALVSKGLALMTLGQISLFRRVFDGATSSSDQPNSHGLWQATIVSCLRSSGQLQFVGEALTGAALASHLDGDHEGACADLEEAQSIAERGPMPLLLADVHLHRARLFGRIPADERSKKFPDIDPKAELREARRLIEKHGYWRRKEELEDAEAAAVHW